jgi:hypothetical protein
MLCTQLITRREPYKGMQPLQVIAAVVFQGKRLPQPQKTDPRYVLSLPPPSSPVPSRPVPSRPACLPPPLLLLSGMLGYHLAHRLRGSTRPAGCVR